MHDSERQIKDLLRAREWTYAELGAQLGISRQAVCEIVKGRTRGATARYALARALGVHPTSIWPEQAA